jgi:hypothetical protein
MNPDLIGFVLDLDEADEHALTQRAVAADARLAAEVAALRQALRPLERLRNAGPVPAGLARRTVEHVWAAGSPRRAVVAVLPANDPAPVGASWLRHRWDAAIACSIVLVMSGLGLQGVSRLHQSYERTACQNNLASVYRSLESYASANNGAYPPVGRAGDFAVALRQTGLSNPGATVTCPAVHVAGGADAPIDYTFNLGYRDAGGRVVGIGHGRLPDESQIPAVSDRPPSGWVPRPSRGNHRGGANVLYLNGNVRFVTGPEVGPSGDHIFVNDGRRIAAGLHPADAVLGEAHDRP